MLQIECIDTVIACYKTFETNQNWIVHQESGNQTAALAHLLFYVLSC